MAGDVLVRRRSSSRSGRRGTLTPSEWTRLGSMLAAIAVLNLIGWGTLVFVVQPAHFSLGDKVFGVGIGLTAYALGSKHAFDVDHIAAIDNVTRKLMNDGQRPLAVGFFFSLGHSTIVFALAALLAFGMKAIIGPVKNDSSALHHYTGLIGTGVSGVFLCLIAIINIVVLAGILRVFARMRSGVYDEAELEEQLNHRGFFNRILGGLTKSITTSWHMYPVGVLFGLGFDTATEVALLVLAGTSAAVGLPWYAILCLPVLFAAGMCLFDTIDGSFMNFAYGWAFSKPVRKVYYNITVTGLSVAVALLIGGLEILQILGQQLALRGAFWDWIQNVSFSKLGFGIVGLFVITWALALVVWRFGRIEERWTMVPQHEA
ncbi:HoxN/HupN/NixA family nickel/cobalt transporter [Mycobacterium sp. SM1]|uniref:HoxN/HupN/NixA family nickel/cobalt transporter n=1 Tax=Mycobacterium sp. SM1 TaxID=2816243 RepID=UPI001BCC8015|nr:HoxN/HupN/NixA family nickel/cobalt transporter [Mycobacterium sp. SM1]MBS4726826.1 HoxN/HupN/NixA family nickel/cobalt transporter [Mycobacterium sp. SM1]